VVIEDGNDANLLCGRRYWNRYGLQFGHAKGVKTRSRGAYSLDLFSDGWRIPKVFEKLRIYRRAGTNSNEVVLMDAALHLFTPHRGAAELAKRTVPLDHQKVAKFELVPLQFTLE
jgi:hypothetical protein